MGSGLRRELHVLRRGGSMTEEHHCLLIPANGKGLPELIHGKDVLPEWVLTNEAGIAGKVVTIGLSVNNENAGLLLTLVGEGQPFNDRAAAALIYLTAVHMVFTGPVVFTDLAPEQYAGILGVLS